MYGTDGFAAANVDEPLLLLQERDEIKGQALFITLLILPLL